jgi:hypothetical protein
LLYTLQKKRNQNNIDLLQEDVTKLLALQTKVDTIQGQIDANTKQLTTLADQVTKMPQ